MYFYIFQIKVVVLGNERLTLGFEHEHRINWMRCVGKMIDFKEVEMG